MLEERMLLSGSITLVVASVAARRSSIAGNVHVSKVGCVHKKHILNYLLLNIAVTV